MAACPVNNGGAKAEAMQQRTVLIQESIREREKKDCSFSASGANEVPEAKKKGLYWFFKRCFDVVFSILLFVLSAPVSIVICIAVVFTCGMPAVYVHERIGQYGKPIRVYKFRTMVKGADQMIDSFTLEQLEEWKNNYRLEKDPRVTRIGKFLRNTKLDELPQFINVIRGELSLVGPRPITKEEWELYGGNKEKLVSIKPGLTGYWQVYAAPSCTTEERRRMELKYVDNANFLWDLRILLGTAGKVISRLFENPQ